MGPAFIGRPIEAIWHTAVVAFGKEYYFDGGVGIVSEAPGTTHFGTPKRKEPMGTTAKTVAEFEAWNLSQRGHFGPTDYHILERNCNAYTEAAVQFLCGRGIPQEVSGQVAELLATPAGQMLRPMIEQAMMQASGQQGAAGGAQGVVGALQQQSQPGVPPATGPGNQLGGASETAAPAGPPRIKRELLGQLLDMGFTENSAKRALKAAVAAAQPGAGDDAILEVAMAWVEQHQEDPSFDQPLQPQEEPEWIVPMTAEEKAAKAKELQERAAARREQREKEERQAELARELKRREDGSQLADIKEEHERRQRMQAYEEQRRRKEEDRKARDEIRAKIEADRIAKGWSPRPGGAAAEAPAAAAATPDAAPVPEVGDAEVAAAIEALKQNPAAELEAAGTVAVLRTLLGNLQRDPLSEKFRKVRMSNAKIDKAVGKVPGAEQLLCCAGFARQGDVLEVPLSAAGPAQRLATKAIGALDAAFPAVAARAGDDWKIPVPAQTGSSAPAPGGGGTPGFGGMDPSALSAMAAGNPMLQQTMQNPAMMQQAQQMMQNPAMMQQMMAMAQQNPQMLQQMMQGGGFGGM
eukprot:TRINITY_DN677_c0_g1_i1.p1 TRINITY_DN677_c0_g1~~TRINITY_DN677_c0_g1_i1.p1  ORF type:complete len:624 (+),score=215.06 TRINITY_DN677_c0_g1_i1:137-1873(+)